MVAPLTKFQGRKHNCKKVDIGGNNPVAVPSELISAVPV